VAPRGRREWETFLKESLGRDWQKIGLVTAENGNLTISERSGYPWIDAPLARMAETWGGAIERRLK
jgi:phosphoribosylformylglycinamidine synthase